MLQNIENKEGINTTRDGLLQVLEKSADSVKNIPTRQVITSFAGLRAHEDGDDFVIGETENDFIDCAGIESPGLSSAPAIGEVIGNLVQKKYDLKEEVSVKSDYYLNTNHEYEVKCQILENGSHLIDMTLTVPTQTEAEAIVNNWNRKNQEIYALLLSQLL